MRERWIEAERAAAVDRAKLRRLRKEVRMLSCCKSEEEIRMQRDPLAVEALRRTEAGIRRTPPRGTARHPRVSTGEAARASSAQVGQETSREPAYTLWSRLRGRSANLSAAEARALSSAVRKVLAMADDAQELSLHCLAACPLLRYLETIRPTTGDAGATRSGRGKRRQRKLSGTRSTREPARTSRTASRRVRRAS